VIIYSRCSESMTVLVAANLSGAGASFRLDLSRWQGQRTREVLWGCEFPAASADWFVYLPAHGFSWWLIGEVDAISEESGGDDDQVGAIEAVQRA
jgi:maltose alpha-D-glucosyltransferase/alpha-amylase